MIETRFYLNAFVYKLFLLFAFFIPAFGVNGEEANGKNGIYTLAKGDMSFCVSAAAGGKIVSFKRDGKEMLLQEDVHPKYYGSTLWLSPQRRFWPPSPVLDSEPYQTEIDGGVLRLSSEKDSLTGFRITKEFSISPDTAILINYIIENISDTTLHVAPWDVTRVNGGITFFSLKDSELNDLSSNLAHVCIEDGVLWYTYSQDSVKRGQKLFATTQNGWLAHYYDSLLLIKRFPLVNKTELPEQQGEVEIFLAPNSLYVELENHGKYTKLEKGESLSYQQKWYLIKVTDLEGDKNKLLNAVKVRSTINL